jgi:NADH-quinone oxidoreductase subunit I
MLNWFRNINIAVATILQALWIGLRYWIRSYDPNRRTFTEKYEFHEKPVLAVAQTKSVLQPVHGGPNL